MDGLLSGILFFSIILTTFNRGFFNLPLFSILCLVLCMLFYVFVNRSKPRKISDNTVTPFVFVCVYSLFLFFSGGIYQSNSVISLFLYALPVLFLPLVFTYLFPVGFISPFHHMLRFKTLFILALILRILIIIASPNPVIDVFTFLKEAPSVFLSGGNPYDHTYSPVYKGWETTNFSYFPASFFLQIPFVTVFGDPRVLLLLCDGAAAYVLYAILGQRKQLAQILTLLYLFRPNSLFMLEQSWMTPLVFLLFLLMVITIIKNKKVWSGVLYGIVSAIQPTYLPLGLFFLTRKNIIRFMGSFLITICILVGPYLFFTPLLFWEKTVAFYFLPPQKLPTIPIYLSLNLNTFAHRLTGNDIPVIFSVFILTVVSVFLFRRIDVISRRILAVTLFYFVFYFLFRQAFIYYYWLATDFLIAYFVYRFCYKEEKSVS